MNQLKFIPSSPHLIMRVLWSLSGRNELWTREGNEWDRIQCEWTRRKRRQWIYSGGTKEFENRFPTLPEMQKYFVKERSISVESEIFLREGILKADQRKWNSFWDRKMRMDSMVSMEWLLRFVWKRREDKKETMSLRVTITTFSYLIIIIFSPNHCGGGITLESDLCEKPDCSSFDAPRHLMKSLPEFGPAI